MKKLLPITILLLAPSVGMSAEMSDYAKCSHYHLLKGGVSSTAEGKRHHAKRWGAVIKSAKKDGYTEKQVTNLVEQEADRLAKNVTEGNAMEIVRKLGLGCKNIEY